ncbi:uncharacterized protein VTP21DRAFT_8796 [Calcarisporiella thermophila]|uniref:uncharacterized protein n=1 Tax=Calcarisporiella thermophila TaxID=911321 RepID=UPI003742E0B8
MIGRMNSAVAKKTADKGQTLGSKAFAFRRCVFCRGIARAHLVAVLIKGIFEGVVLVEESLFKYPVELPNIVDPRSKETKTSHNYLG